MRRYLLLLFMACYPCEHPHMVYRRCHNPELRCFLSRHNLARATNTKSAIDAAIIVSTAILQEPIFNKHINEIYRVLFINNMLMRKRLTKLYRKEFDETLTIVY